ncbi:hypothetical protein [Nitrosomonas halophila]|uniref:Uncharacterized protein n=1 Tax=Nitrosomonas halophila TaxID=44576 RepID=A0A1H3LVQ7_9PROT|nr:hypothetical protein [Nitrosomonas halophila]SDY68078.1 hypothetical protein SAMN05421881_10537 [Nitrosomonas halophila]
MKFDHYKSTLFGIFLLGASQVHAQDIENNIIFSEPGKICFPQTSLYASSEELTSVMLDHHLVVNEEDHFKVGDVFVVFRLKGHDGLWLYNGSEWRENFDPTNYEFFIQNPYLKSNRLQPIIPTSVSNYPINVNEYIGIGELWVGYGLRSEEETAQVSYNEMIESGRLNLIWEVGESIVPKEAPLTVPTLCISITEMTEIIHLIGHGPIFTEEEN